MSEPWASAARRWSEAATLLAATGRGPSDARDWLGSAWAGDAATAFDGWARTFDRATRQAAGALEDAARVARALSAAPDPVGSPRLDRVHEAARAVEAVPVPGRRAAPPRHSTPPPKPARRPAAPKPGGAVAVGPKPRGESAGRPPKPSRAAAEPAGPSGAAAAAPAGPSGGSVSSWIAQAVRILREHGYRPDQMDPAAIATIIRHESSGDPSAVNNWDSNATRGTPSMGLMQTIRPTFERWHLPGHDQILNPVDNIIAGVRYAVARYGSVSEVPGVLSLAAGKGYRGY